MSKAKRKVLLVVSVLLLAGLATLGSQKHSTALPLPNGESYYSPTQHSKNPLYGWQIKPAANPSICLAITEIDNTSGYGWPLPYNYQADFGCPGDYVTITPLAAMADFAFYAVLFSGVLYMFPRIPHKVRNSS